jgi:hypothetical protein
VDPIAAAQPTQILSSFSEVREIIVGVQLFGTKAATMWIVFRRLLHPDLIRLRGGCGDYCDPGVIRLTI